MNMIIGFANGDFHSLFHDPMDRFVNAYINYSKAGGANAIELHCGNEQMVDYLLDQNEMDISCFPYVSLHAPVFAYTNNEQSHRMLSKLDSVTKKYNIKNVVFHTDRVEDWNVFTPYKQIPISIENMDDHKQFGNTIDDVKSILDYHPFHLTLDLQHCFVNDPSMKWAHDFQEIFQDRIVEYHISGSSEEPWHYPLYKTHQDNIIHALRFTALPIIIESSFSEIGDQEKELKYITKELRGIR